MSSRRLRPVFALTAAVALVVIAILTLMQGGGTTPAATPGAPVPSVPVPPPSTATVPPNILPGIEPPGGAIITRQRPIAIGTPDPVVHFTGTPVDHHIVLPALPAPPARTPVPPALQEAPGQAHPCDGIVDPTPVPTGGPPLLIERVSLPAGWNIVNEFVAFQLTGQLNSEPAYTFAAGDSDYRTVLFDRNHPPSFKLSGPGYWVFLPAPLEATMPAVGLTDSPLDVDPGWTMVASEDCLRVRVLGADLVVVYDPEMAAYQTADQRLPIGTGVWVYSAEGAEIAFRP